MLEFPRSSSLRDSRECSQDSHWRLDGYCCYLLLLSLVIRLRYCQAQDRSVDRSLASSRSLSCFLFLRKFPRAGCVTPAGRKFRGAPLSLKLKLSDLDNLYIESFLVASEARVISRRKGSHTFCQLRILNQIHFLASSVIKVLIYILLANRSS